MKMVDKTSKLEKFTANMVGGSGTAGGGTGGGSGTVGAAVGNVIGSASGSTIGGIGSTGTGQGSSSNAGILTGHHYHHSSMQNGQKPVPMKLFAAWEVDRTPPNCIPRLCSLTITRLTILTPLPGDMTSLSLAVKMQSSKRTLRSHEIPITTCGMQQQAAANSTPTTPATTTVGSGINLLQPGNNSNVGVAANASGIIGATGSPGNMGNTNASGSASGGGIANNFTATGSATATPLSETELDFQFSLQYPHFIKRDGNRLVILLQRRKKYKSRTILGYKTLAEGIIRMDAVLQKSMDMTVELTASGKNGRPGATVATLRAERVSSIPVDHDNKNNNSVLLADRVAEYSDEDEEGEFSSGEFINDEANELGIPGYDPKRDYNPSKHDMRKYRKLQRSEIEDVALAAHHHHHNPVDSDSEFEMKDKNSSRAKISRTISLQQRNFKQKIVALLKRFKASEEMEGDANRGTAALRGERDLDALFQELESLSCCEGDDSGPDMDSLSIGSTPKPSLRPFFTNSRIMLHDNGATGGNYERRSSDKSDQLTNSSYNIDNNKQKSIHLTNNNNSATTPDRLNDNRNDSSGNEGNAVNTDGQNSDPQNSPPRGDKEFLRLQHHQQQQLQQQQTPVNTSVTNANAAHAAVPATIEKQRSRLFRTSSSTPGGLMTSSNSKKKQTLSLAAEPRSVLETCLSPTNVEPRKMLLDQLSRVFASEDATIPDVVTMITPAEALGGSSLITKLTNLFGNTFKPAFAPQNTAEVKAVMQALMGKIQKYCNSNAKPPTTVKILLIGGDWLQGATLRHYVELMGVRPPDWLNHLRFYIVPISNSGNNTISRYLSQMDQAYAGMFGSENWHQLLERAAATAAAVSVVNTVNSNSITSALDGAMSNKSDILEVVTRIQRYLHAAGPCTQIPIAEAMVNYKDEDSCQIFVPFVSDVRIGYLEGPHASMDLEESSALAAANALAQQQQSSMSIPIMGNNSSNNLLGSNTVSGSPPQQQSGSGRTSPPLLTPPSSASSYRERGSDVFQTPPQSAGTPVESVELQVDYWPLVRPGEHSSKDKGGITRSSDQGGKNSIKSTFRNLQVWRLPQNIQMGDMTNGLTVSFATKEKKQKQIMRLGKKKEKDRDLEKEQCVEGVARLICSPKQSHPVPLRVYIDGTEWTGVKFFQLSSQWQTHVKNFPIALIGCTPMSCAEIS